MRFLAARVCTPRRTANTVMGVLRRYWRPLLTFALLFRILESLLFAPAAALVGKWLLNRTVLDSTAIVGFLLSPQGLLALGFGVLTALSIRLVEHAGLSAIFFGGIEGRTVTARQAFRLVWMALLDLVNVSGRFLGAVFLTSFPLLLTIGGFAAWLLPKHDVNFYLKLRPPEFLMAASIIGILGIVTAAAWLWLIIRWRWVVQVILFQGREPGAAFPQSSWLTLGCRPQLVKALAAVTLVAAALVLLASMLGTGLNSAVVALLGEGTASLAVFFGVLLAIRVVVGTVCTFLGSCLDAGVFTTLYLHRTSELRVATVLRPPEGAGRERAPAWVPLVVVLAFVTIAATGTWFALSALNEDRTITIHAHRGFTRNAPENTLSAVRDAIAARADYVEVDVQLSKDGVLVVVHDSDFSRLASVPRRVWELTYDQIRSIPLGSDSTPGVPQATTPTLQAVLAEVKGKARLNIELKYYGGHQSGLAAKVVDAVRTAGMIDQVVIQCLEYEPLLEVRMLAPNVPIGYLLSFNARKPARLEVDFLSVEQNRVDRRFLMDAHRRGKMVYAWTVNKPDDMQRLFSLGIDGIITDEPGLAREILTRYLDVPAQEQALARVRAWLED